MLYIKDNRSVACSTIYQFTGLSDSRMDMFKFSSGSTFNYSKGFVSKYFIKLKER